MGGVVGVAGVGIEVAGGIAVGVVGGTAVRVAGGRLWEGVNAGRTIASLSRVELS